METLKDYLGCKEENSKFDKTNNKKTCSKCKAIKERFYFVSDVSKQDGLRYTCKECDKEYREKTKHLTRERNKRYIDSHKEEIKKRNKKYIENNRGKVNESAKKRRRENADKINEYRRNAYKENAEWYKGYAKNWRDTHVEEVKKIRFGPVSYKTYGDKLTVDESPQKNNDGLLMVECAKCGNMFYPYRKQVELRIDALNGKQRGECRLYCSQECKDQCGIYNQKLYHKDHVNLAAREVQPELRSMCLERDNFTCQICGSTDKLCCHHYEGLNHNPIESADLDAVIILCKKCHLQVHKLPGCSQYDMQCHPSI